jgi:hypothetical protein
MSANDEKMVTVMALYIAGGLFIGFSLCLWFVQIGWIKP